MIKIINNKTFYASLLKAPSKVIPNELKYFEHQKGWYARVLKVKGYYYCFSTNPEWRSFN
jgi:hypothetical protein